MRVHSLCQGNVPSFFSPFSKRTTSNSVTSACLLSLEERLTPKKLRAFIGEQCTGWLVLALELEPEFCIVQPDQQRNSCIGSTFLFFFLSFSSLCFSLSPPFAPQLPLVFNATLPSCLNRTDCCHCFLLFTFVTFDRLQFVENILFFFYKGTKKWKKIERREGRNKIFSSGEFVSGKFRVWKLIKCSRVWLILDLTEANDRLEFILSAKMRE